MPTLRNVTAGIDLSVDVARVTSPLGRAVGWLGAVAIAPERGKWFEPCSAVHTVGMRSSLDIIMLDRDARVVALRSRVTPNRLCVTQRRTARVVEMGPGFLDTATVAVGDVLALIEPGDAVAKKGQR